MSGIILEDRSASQDALTKAGISCEDCEGYIYRGIEILTTQRDELLAALKEVSSAIIKHDEWIDRITDEAISRGDEGVSLSYMSGTEDALINENYRKALIILQKYDHA